ncbi:cache domain-containing sensor histidine kinase [Paenibacillus crassostreae]|uniref:Histidine kinase n=1 Tax=Paenibacillus crassostreae TaxID=1763538 RepID=A0A167FJ15_9BACL|nr:histidine kinase [Paenibacillus crassostreae]AOZ94355.1 two-component sensor histidine kinase [Paenibacillus crassostreae]OAB76608.1 histidine kinase [Paenibacillus crassostreae]
MLHWLKIWIPRSIRHKLIIASITCIVVPAVLTLFIYNSLTQEAVKQQALSNAEDSLELVNNSVSNLFNNMLSTMNYIQVNSGMTTYFKQVSSGHVVGSPYMKFMDSNRILEQLDSLTVVGVKSYVTVLLTNGMYYMNYSVSDYNPRDLLKEPWFKNLQELEGLQSYWVGVEPTAFQYDAFDHPYQISVARTLRLANSEIYGYVVVTVMEDQISSILGNLSAGSEIQLIDHTGHIISKQDHKDIGTKFNYLDPSIEQKSSSILNLKEGHFLLSQQQIPYAGWFLVLMQPYNEAIVNISSIFNRVFIFQISSFVIFLILLIYLVRTFTQPLVTLGKVTSAVQRGNLQLRSGVRGNDEIGHLGIMFDQMLDRVKEMIAEVSVTQRRKRKAELRMLQAQINPHFLFNVLNSIRMKVLKRGDPESALMITSLSTLLRMTISREEDEIHLHEEIELVTHYLRLMNMRQKEEVTLVLDIAPEAFMIKVPRLFLQPIVENAMIHGLSQRAGTISITAEIYQCNLILSVQDNGMGMDSLTIQRIISKWVSSGIDIQTKREDQGSFSGMGLQNVVERMRILFGDGFDITVNSKQGVGTDIILIIPYLGGEQDVQSHVGR